MITSVIIPVYNDADRLKLCLDALAEQNVDRDSFEVIIVDNGSKEPPKELVESYSFCRFTEESKPGSYAARNRGLEIAQGSIIAFTDADCLPEPTWLEAGVGELDNDESCSMTGGPIVVFPLDDQKPTSAELYDIAFGLPQEHTMKQNGRVMTANLITRRSVFDKVGPFNSDLMSFGDQEWSGRVVDAGMKVTFVPDAVVRHPARYDVAGLVKQMRRHVGGMVDQKDKVRKRTGVSRFIYLAQRWILPDFRKIIDAQRQLKKRGYGLTSWIRTVGVILWLQYTGLFEYFRKRLGATSERQ